MYLLMLYGVKGSGLMQFKKTAATLLAGVLLCTSAVPSFAWKLTSHVYSGNLVLEDLQDGYLTIDGYGEYKVPDEFYNAITRYPNAYRAGTMGPDVYPEMATGQGNIHAWEEGQDLKYSSGAYFDIMINEYLQMPLSHPEREKALAFILGYATHYSGDLYGHPWVNKWAGGVFPSMTEMDERENVEIALRHILTEGYMDSKVPEEHKTGDGIEIDAPKEFVRDTLIKKAAEKSEVSFFLEPIVDLEENLKRTSEENKAFNGNFLDYALDTNIAGYADKWSEDIDTGLIKWITANEQMAKNMLDKDKSTSDAITPIEEWVTEYGLRISGSPDALAQALNMSVDTILELLNLVTTEDIREKLSELKRDAVYYAIKESTGLDLEEILEAMKDPEPILNSDLFDTGNETTQLLDEEFKNFGQTDDMAGLEFAPFYNTVQMAKLTLIGADNLKSIFPNSGFRPQETIETIDKLDIRIRTHSGKFYHTHGTDDDVFFYIKLADGSEFEVLMDHPGQNDFEKGNEDTYRLELPRRIRYEEISSVGIRKKNIVNDDWNPDWFRVSVPGLDPFYYSDGDFSGKTFNGNDTFERSVSLANSISGYSQLDPSIINFIRTLDGNDQWVYSSIYNNDRDSYDVVLNGGANSGVGFASIYNDLKQQSGMESYQHYYEFDDKDEIQTMGKKWSFGDVLECKTSGHAVAVIDTYTFDDFVAETELNIKKGGNAGIEYRMTNVKDNENNYQGYMAGIGIKDDGQGYAFIGRQNFDYKGLNDTFLTINPDQNYELRLEADGPEMKLYVDDVLAVTAKDSMFKKMDT